MISFQSTHQTSDCPGASESCCLGYQRPGSQAKPPNTIAMLPRYSAGIESMNGHMYQRALETASQVLFSIYVNSSKLGRKTPGQGKNSIKIWAENKEENLGSPPRFCSRPLRWDMVGLKDLILHLPYLAGALEQR